MNNTRPRFGLLECAGLLLLACAGLPAAEFIVLDVPGGSFRGTVVKVTKDEVVLREGSGRERSIPAAMLTPKQMYLCRKQTLDPKDAKGCFDLGEFCLDKGLKLEAEDEFLNAVRIDPATYREKAYAMLGAGPKASKPAGPATLTADLGALKAAEQTNIEIYKKFAPAVVGISCKGTPSGSPRETMFTGTGAVVTPDGLILTNATAVPKDAKEIKVYFTDGHVRVGELKAFEEKTEGALIKVEAKGLPCMRLANAEEYKVGDPVYSWGNPHFTIARDGVVSLSVGTISGLYNVSSVDNESRYLGAVIETDAAINPGSDGGPLTDSEGNLLGILSLSFSKTRWLGLAVPVHRLIETLPLLKPLGKAKRPLLAGLAGQAWAIQKAMAEVSGKASLATVAVYALREGDAAEPPENRKTAELKLGESYPMQWRAMFEARRPPLGTSSGFLVAADGTVVTSAFNVDEQKVRQGANSVTRKVTKIFVYLADGLRLDAKLLGKDKFFDLAVLKIQGAQGKAFPYVELCDSGALVQGSSVALLGRSEPPGEVTVNVGRVSATQRYRDTCCQISSMLDYGNQGGPVIDLQGRVVGMAAHLAEGTSWRQNCGVGFMLQAEHIKLALPDLIAGKVPEHRKQAVLGVQGDDGALDVKGARIVRVVPNGPAERGGMKEGDIVVQFNGKPIEDWLSLLTEIRAAEAGKTVPVKVRRDKQELELKVELGDKE